MENTGNATTLARSTWLSAALMVAGAACSRPALVGDPEPIAAGLRSPCLGGALQLDQIVEACASRWETKPAPTPPGLRVELAPAEVSVRSGEEVELSVRMTNAGTTPMDLDVTLGCLEFEAAAHHAGAAARADEEYSDECADVGGLCGSVHVRVTLEAQGVLTKRVQFAARVKRLEKAGDACDWRPARPLSPGRYRLRVALPFYDPVPGSSDSYEPRVAEGSVVVVP